MSDSTHRISNGICRITLLLATLLLFCFPAFAIGKTYYVNGQSGSDSNDGSAAHPFKTLQKATGLKPWDNLLVAGDTVLIAPGTYFGRVVLAANATASAPITIKAQDPNNRPIFDYHNDAYGAGGAETIGGNDRAGWEFDGSYYVVDGIIIKNARSDSTTPNTAGVRIIDPANNLKFSHMLIQGFAMGFMVGIGSSHDITLEYSEISGNGGNSVYQHNVYISGGDNVAIRYSYIHDSVGGQNIHMLRCTPPSSTTGLKKPQPMKWTSCRAGIRSII